MKLDPAAKAAARQAIADRRRKVAALALARVSQQEIARQLNVSEATISKDLAFARAQWAAERQADIGAERAQELARLAADEAQWRRKLQAEPGLLGQLGIYDRIHRIGERRAKMLGLDAPTKIAPTTPDGAQQWQPGPDAVRAALAALRSPDAGD
jgi:hypothetical protein